MMVLSRRLALAVLVCLSLVLFGCSGNKYVPCCAKSGIYNQATKLLEEYPECTLSGKYTNTFHNCEKNQTLFDAGVVRCKLTDCIGVGIRTECEKIGCVWDGPNPGACHTPQCADINNNIDCEMALCYWDNSSLINHGVCIGSDAWSILPICGDAAPQSCVNEKCTAMMCGYTSFKPGPPIASQDWDPNASVDNASHAPASDLGMSVNLYQTTCDFATMNSRLYSKVKNSKGALWVNAFRFGVGKSFSDYDLSRNFFPASDRFCNVNEGGTVDRYMNYFGNSQICRPPVYSSYICTKNSLGFINQSMCWLYCNNDHMDCGNTSGVRYSCQSTGVTYDTFDGCKAECDPVPANTCTNSNVQFPFLDASGRFHEKLVADYWLDTAGIRAPDDSGQVCIYRSITPSDYMSYNGWYCNNEHGCSHWACNDWYGGYTNEGWGGPWMANVRDPVTGAPPNMGDALSDDLNLNAYYTNHRTVAVDLDFKYYDVGLFYQFVHEAGANPDNTLPYECISSADCMSGFCDQSNYHRSLINMVDGSTHESGCVTLKDGKTMPYLDCSSGFTPDQINGFAAKSEPTSGYFDSGGTYALLTHGEIFSTDGDENNLAYFVPVGPSYGFFDQCGIDHGETQSLCTYSDDCNYGYDGIFLYPSVSGSCPAHSCLKNTAGPSQYKVFAIDFHTNSPPGNWGNCDVASPSKRPYMNMTELGWCEACTYSTLAVQKVGWGADEPYGYAKQGQGISAPLACYEFRGTYDYNATPLSSGTIDYSTGANGLYNSYPGATIEAGVNRSIQSASASQVQKNKDGYYIDGNIGRGKYSANGVFEAASSYYTCNDEWQSGTGWWSNSQLPNPSAPYLREKLQSYLKSNVMPILDVIPSQSSLAPVLGSQYNHGSSRECCRYFGVWSNSYSDCWGSCDTEGDCPSTRHYCVEGRYPVYANSYSPTEICTAYSADGAIIYVVGNTSMLASTSETYGSILQDDKAITRAVVDELGLASSDNPGLLLDGKSAIITRALLLKYTCAHPPLVAVEIDKDATLEELIGTDLMVRDSALRGSLHRFFYDKQQQYAYHVYNGKPETYPDNIDLFMQSWEPKCLNGVGIENKTKIEFESKLDFTRALSGNFSKPSLIWKFHFPAGSECRDDSSPANSPTYNYFLDYLFNRTGDMVDAGMIGIIYDNWMTESGKGYGPTQVQLLYHGGDPTAYRYATVNYGLDPNIAEGALDTTSGKSAAFCSVQRYSKKVIGLVQYTYGQKLYGGDSACDCTPCTQNDYLTRLCDPSAQNNETIPQLYCNGGYLCNMPSGVTDYRHYKCPSNCLDAAACQYCSESADTSFCRIEMTDALPYGNTMPLVNVTDLDWEMIAGLPARDKCCLMNQPEGSNISLIYTFLARKGAKQQSEFLQYPTRAEEGIDCGRVPNTDSLKYCGINIPISQKQIDCNLVQGGAGTGIVIGIPSNGSLLFGNG